MQIKDGVPYLHRYGFDPVAIQERTKNRNVSFWCGVFGDEAQKGNTPRLAVQVEDDRCSDLWSIIHLWGQFISYPQYSAFIVYSEGK